MRKITCTPVSMQFRTAKGDVLLAMTQEASLLSVWSSFPFFFLGKWSAPPPFPITTQFANYDLFLPLSNIRSRVDSQPLYRDAHYPRHRLSSYHRTMFLDDLIIKSTREFKSRTKIRSSVCVLACLMIRF